MILFIAGVSFSANAQMCKITGGVEATDLFKGGTGELKVKLSNTNDYKVTVDISVTVIDVQGNEIERSKTVVISANKEKIVTFKGKKIKKENSQEKYYEDVDIWQSQVNRLIVSKCD